LGGDPPRVVALLLERERPRLPALDLRQLGQRGRRRPPDRRVGILRPTASRRPPLVRLAEGASGGVAELEAHPLRAVYGERVPEAIGDRRRTGPGAGVPT